MDSLTKIIESDGMISWILVSVFILLFVLLGVFIIIRLIENYKNNKNASDDSLDDIKNKAKNFVDKPYQISQVIFEIIISNTCIVTMMYIYYWIMDKIPFIDDFLNLLLLFLIIIAVAVNNIIDKKLRQDMLEKIDKANIRLVSSMSIMLIFIFIRIKFNIVEYDKLILCYMGVVLGRFIYFDLTITQIKESIESFFKYVIPMFISLLLTFVTGYLGMRYRVITETNLFLNLVVIHIIMIVSIYLSKKIAYEFMDYFGGI